MNLRVARWEQGAKYSRATVRTPAALKVDGGRYLIMGAAGADGTAATVAGAPISKLRLTRQSLPTPWASIVVDFGESQWLINFFLAAGGRGVHPGRPGRELAGPLELQSSLEDQPWRPQAAPSVHRHHGDSGRNARHLKAPRSGGVWFALPGGQLGRVGSVDETPAEELAYPQIVPASAVS